MGGSPKASESGQQTGLGDIDKQLDQLKAQLADLTSHYTDKYPDVRKTREQIALLEATRKRVVADTNSGANNNSSTPGRLPRRRSIRRAQRCWNWKAS